MGAYSSWPIMALTHHAIVRYCGGTKYGLLGDDIVIVGKRVAQRYQQVMSQLGVDISISKSVLPSKDGRTSSAEIAKRIFKDGIEVTPLPAKLMEQSVKHPILLAELLKWTTDRWGGEYFLTPSKSLIQDFYLLFKKKEAEAVFDLISWPHGPYFCDFAEEIWLDAP